MLAFILLLEGQRVEKKESDIEVLDRYREFAIKLQIF